MTAVPSTTSRPEELPAVEPPSRRAPAPPANAVEGDFADPMQVLTPHQRREKAKDLDSLARGRRDAEARSAAVKLS